MLLYSWKLYELYMKMGLSYFIKPIRHTSIYTRLHDNILGGKKETPTKPLMQGKTWPFYESIFVEKFKGWYVKYSMLCTFSTNP